MTGLPVIEPRSAGRYAMRHAPVMGQRRARQKKETGS
jgi:hypothetical protein